MRNHTHTTSTKSSSNHNIAARIGRWSVQHRRTAILGWLAFVFVSMAIGFNLMPQKNIEQMDGMPGESGKAGQILNDAYPDKSGEQALIQSKSLKASDPEFRAAVADVSKRLKDTKGVDHVAAPQISKDGHSALVTFELPGKAEVTKESVVQSLAAVDAAQKAHPELRIAETGDASIQKAEKDKSDAEMGS